MAVAIGAAIMSKPLWLVCVLGVVAAIGLYGMLAPLLRWWPWSHHEDVAGAGENVSLEGWLGQQIQELRGLLRRLEEVLPADPFEPNKAYAVQEHLWEIVRDVDRRLHTSAPEWVDYFNEDHARYPVEVVFPKADLYANQLVPAIESTIDQIAHIQARLPE